MGIGLAVARIPAFADLPLTVHGTVNDLTMDRFFGKDRLETANLTIAILPHEYTGRSEFTPSSVALDEHSRIEVV